MILRRYGNLQMLESEFQQDCGAAITHFEITLDPLEVPLGSHPTPLASPCPKCLLDATRTWTSKVASSYAWVPQPDKGLNQPG